MSTLKISLTWLELRSSYSSEPVERLQRFGVTDQLRGLDCDGAVGPITRSATYLNPAVFFLAIGYFKELKEKCPSMSPTDMAMSMKRQHGIYVHPIACAAFQDVWDMKGEDEKNNHGPFIAELFESKSEQGGHWCGVAGRRWIRKVYPDALPDPESAWMAKGLARKMRKVGAPRLVESGDQITQNRKIDGSYDNGSGHATTCAVVDGDRVWTFEGNIDVTRARNGLPSLDGCATRCYLISEGLTSPSGAKIYRVSRWPEVAS